MLSGAGNHLFLAAAYLPAALNPVVVLILCIVAGIGTAMALPGRRSALTPKIGAMLLAIGFAILAVGLVKWTVDAMGTAGVTRASYIYFWVFSLVALAASLRVITHPKPVYSALYFVLTVFATAGLFLLMWAEFMAAALVLIYAGAILVTYVFVIMLASEASAGGSTNAASSRASLPEHDSFAREPFLASLMGFAMMGVILFVIFDRANEIAANPAGGAGLATSRMTGGTAAGVAGSATPASGEPRMLDVERDFGPTQKLGTFLFERHFVNIQLAGLLLTLAMVGAIMIARKKIVGVGATAHEAMIAASPLDLPPEVVLGPATPVSDDPHSIDVVGTRNPRQKVYPEN